MYSLWQGGPHGVQIYEASNDFYTRIMEDLWSNRTVQRPSREICTVLEEAHHRHHTGSHLCRYTGLCQPVMVILYEGFGANWRYVTACNGIGLFSHQPVSDLRLWWALGGYAVVPSQLCHCARAADILLIQRGSSAADSTCSRPTSREFWRISLQIAFRWIHLSKIK